MVFQMTVRMASCKELADDPKSVQKVNDLFRKLESGATPVALLLGILLEPWFPNMMKKYKEEATKELYDLLYSYVDARRKADVQNSDPIDVLIADGADNATVVGVRICIFLSFN